MLESFDPQKWLMAIDKAVDILPGGDRLFFVVVGMAIWKWVVIPTIAAVKRKG